MSHCRQPERSPQVQRLSQVRQLSQEWLLTLIRHLRSRHHHCHRR